jgi:hypothetical protein
MKRKDVKYYLAKEVNSDDATIAMLKGENSL